MEIQEINKIERGVFLAPVVENECHIEGFGQFDISCQLNYLENLCNALEVRMSEVLCTSELRHGKEVVLNLNEAYEEFEDISSRFNVLWLFSAMTRFLEDTLTLCNIEALDDSINCEEFTKLSSEFDRNEKIHSFCYQAAQSKAFDKIIRSHEGTLSHPFYFYIKDEDVNDSIILDLENEVSDLFHNETIEALFSDAGGSDINKKLLALMGEKAKVLVESTRE